MSKVQGSVATINSFPLQKSSNAINRIAGIDRFPSSDSGSARRQNAQPLLKKVLPQLVQQLSGAEKAAKPTENTADNGHTSNAPTNYMLKMLFNQLDELGEKLKMLDESPANSADLAMLRKALAKNKLYLERALMGVLQSNTQQMVKAGSGNAFKGSMGKDVILGSNSNDWLFGGVGDDLLIGGYGDDKLEGGAGDDILNGGAGMDTLYGGEGMDTLNGGEGKDTIHAIGGNDEVNAGSSNDNILSGLSNNTAESNIIDGGEGNDIVRYANNKADYTIHVNSAEEGNYTVTNRKTGASDMLKNVERVHFRNGTIKVSSLKTDSQKK
ncbi:MAG TPA: hypothetical protein ENJ33_06180 [Thiothrix sp.]|nr:hypothetical protein [Thiothrix sp.]